MSTPSNFNGSHRIVRAVHGREDVATDPDFEVGLAASLRAQYGYQGLVELYARFALGEGHLDVMMRRAIWRAAARSVGHGLVIGPGAGFKHLDRAEIGDAVFIGAQAYIQGRFDGTCIIGNHVWIGPQAYFDARDLILGDYVGWGPGAKVLGSTHTGVPVDVPIVQTDLDIKPVRIEAWADVGMNAVVLPGITVGRGAIVGAGAVVTKDVPPFSIVAGVPARIIGTRTTDPERESRAGEMTHVQV
ncbi:MAG: N-acetyltransferase [Acidobacteria bacterium 13_1_40CM_3_65_5]|nr:MAG: N-acetyltransferase [Acidobacteria bacterium 13_1_40CM_4_65_8]OLD14598.1 MAG: N-acetyltransferase [Acidobacteria bacterium 13_1_40CM_3_65_5]